MSGAVNILYIAMDERRREKFIKIQSRGRRVYVTRFGFTIVLVLDLFTVSFGRPRAA